MAIRVYFYDWYNELVATATYKDGKISFSGPKGDAIGRTMEEERYNLDWEDGRVWYSIKENPKELMLNLYRIYTGSALRASRPMVVND